MSTKISSLNNNRQENGSGGFFMHSKEITELEVQKKNSKRISVFLDHEFAFGIDSQTGSSLKVGDFLTEAQIESLINQDQRQKAYDKSLRLLSYRDRSEAEIRNRIISSGMDEEQANYAIARLKEQRFLDDENFSQNWVENQNDFRPRSKRALRYELRKKGISEENIQKALESANDADTAVKLAVKYREKNRSVDEKSFRVKLGRYLSGKGYDYEIIRDTTRKVLTSDSDLPENGTIEEKNGNTID